MSLHSTCLDVVDLLTLTWIMRLCHLMVLLSVRVARTSVCQRLAQCTTKADMRQPIDGRVHIPTLMIINSLNVRFCFVWTKNSQSDSGCSERSWTLIRHNRYDGIRASKVVTHPIMATSSCWSFHFDTDSAAAQKTFLPESCSVYVFPQQWIPPIV